MLLVTRESNNYTDNNLIHMKNKYVNTKIVKGIPVSECAIEG